jgi:hypothetical protein
LIDISAEPEVYPNPGENRASHFHPQRWPDGAKEVENRILTDVAATPEVSCASREFVLQKRQSDTRR